MFRVDILTASLKSSCCILYAPLQNPALPSRIELMCANFRVSAGVRTFVVGGSIEGKGDVVGCVACMGIRGCGIGGCRDGHGSVEVALALRAGDVLWKNFSTDFRGPSTKDSFFSPDAGRSIGTSSVEFPPSKPAGLLLCSCLVYSSLSA